MLVVKSPGRPGQGSAIPPVIATRDLTKVYRVGSVAVAALRGVTLTIQRGEFVAVMGPSGSGKTTLMNILGCLDQPTSGQYYLDGREVSGLSDDQLSAIRGRRIGFVFQGFNLLPREPAVEQVTLPLVYAGLSNRRARAIAALNRVGLGHRVNHRPTELSGGQQQRVAIARALVTGPSLILADEPTGNLDSRSSLDIMGIFQRLNRETGLTVVLVTHEPDIARYARRIIHVRDGAIESDAPNATPAPENRPEGAAEAGEAPS